MLRGQGALITVGFGAVATPQRREELLAGEYGRCSEPERLLQPWG